MANICTTLQVLQQNILSDSDSETESRRSRRHNGQLFVHDPHHRCRSSSSDGSRKSVDSVYIPRPRYRKQFIERGIIPRPPLSDERRTKPDCDTSNRCSSIQSTQQNVSVCVQSEISSNDRDSVDEVFKKIADSQPKIVDRCKLDIPRCSGSRRKCGSVKRERSSEDSRKESAEDVRKRNSSRDTSRDRGTSDESRKSSFDEVFIPKTNSCGSHCLSGPEYIRCRCCGRFKKPETYQTNEMQRDNASPQHKQPMLQVNNDRNPCSADSETNNIEDKPPPIPKRKPLKKTKPGTFQPTQIIKNPPCDDKPVKHITFKEDTNENTVCNINETNSTQSVSAGAVGMFVDSVPVVMTSRSATAASTPRSRGPLPVLPSYEDIIGARGFGFRRTSERNQWNQCTINSEHKNSSLLEHPGLRLRSHSIDSVDRHKLVNTNRSADARTDTKQWVRTDRTTDAGINIQQLTSSDTLDVPSRKIIVEFLV